MKTEPLPPTDRVQCDQIFPLQGLHSGQFKHRQVNNTGGQTVLHRQFAAIAQATSFLRSLAERIIFRPLTHLITYGEFLSTRKQKIKQSKSEPQRRFPFLLNNLTLLSTRFDGADGARLYDFSKGCCFGLASSYALYEQMGFPEEYDELLGTVSQDPALGWIFWNKHYAHLADAIVDAQQMFKDNPATQDHQTLFLLKLRPFCESLLAFHAPQNTTLHTVVPDQNTMMVTLL